ncbi:MAG: DUF5320 family protein [Bacteroidales bacterium]|nr:DUF5320 family protein [Bacteroidales bacterium]
MAHLNYKGPEEKGPKTGRMLGKCKKTKEEGERSPNYELGKGMGRHRKGECSSAAGNRNQAGGYPK